MSVLVKGMEMPENCFECPCCRHDSIDGIKAEQCNLTLDVFGVNNTERWIGRGQNCPLTEVKEPHGNLVDLDQMVNDYWDSHSMVIGHKELDEIEVVIEAEGREE